ncbi:P-loop containing nucleoside triphosphate hydrolase protein [Lentinula novae-zelandiae]|nr:P-loop containing nucleoside triphosphate hydrolase protein [Lentinula novae-zelandiae]
MFFNLPQIAVIGSQSAGKSTLIEAVSGISVPRDSGICTRCPVEVSMISFVKEWKCMIQLRIEYDPSGGLQGNSTLIEFCTLSPPDRANVDLWLRRAQASILCRERPISDFQIMGLNELKRLKPGEGSMLAFSMNVIQVQLEDPEATDLTFIDLPGLIQNASQSEISIAQDLVKKNIEEIETVILVTIPMSDEMENQEAVRLAKQADPSGDRTIGVLTKPDTITRGAIGSRERWKEVLQGKLHRFHHGYYCVRLADDEERAKRLSRSQSEVLATDFFAKTEPWSGFVDRSRFGVPNFVKDMSKLLLGMIEANLPELRVAVDQLILECLNDLEAIPIVPTKEPSTEILLRISDFCRDVMQAVMGEDHKFLVQDNKRHYETFKVAIERTNPDFWPFISKEDHSNPNLHVQGGSVGPLDLEDVRKEIAEALTWELPGTIPFDAVKKIVLKSTAEWSASTNKCFDSVFQTTSSVVGELIEYHFKQFSKLEALIKSLVHFELDTCKTKAMGIIHKLLSHESVPLYTQNDLDLATEKSKWLSNYTNVHRNPGNYYISQKLPFLTSTSPPRPVVPPHTYNDELSVMATVSAYFQVAAKRFVDHIPLAIEHELNQFFAANVHQALLQDLMSGTDVPGRLKDLLSEDEGITTRRQFLNERLTRLEEIREKLSQFEH